MTAIGGRHSPMMRTKRSNSFYMGIASMLLLLVAFCWFVSRARQWVLNDNLNEAAFKGDLNRVQLLLAQGVDIEGRSLHYLTPLMSAADGGQTKVASYLIQKGANVNALNGNSSGTVLMYAAATGNVDMIKLLLRNGADVNWRHGNDSALTIAKQYKHSKAVKVLEEAGAVE